MPRRFAVAFVAAIGFVVAAPWTASAATATWTGAASNLWSNGGNWSGTGGTAPAAGSDLVFPAGAANLSTSNDLTAGRSFNSITISGGGYTLAGNAIALAASGISDTNASSGNTISLAISMASTATINVATSTETLTVSGILSGAGGISKSGAGSLKLTAANTYSGATTISAGTLKLGIVSAVPSASTVADNGTFDLGNFSPTIGSLSGSGTVTNSGGGNVALTLGGDNTSTTFSGVLSGGAHQLTLTKNGTGTLTLSGVNTYSGATTINAGTIAIAADSGLGAAPSSNQSNYLVFGGGTLATTATFTLSTNRGATFNSTATIDVAAGTTLTYAGVAQGSAGLTKTDSGTLVLSGANSFAGATSIGAGTLSISSDANLGHAPGSATAGYLVFGGGTLATTATFSLSSNRGISLTSSGTIDVASATTLTYGGIAAGSGGLTKIDTGTLLLSGTNTYSGATTISAGTLKTGVANAISSASGVSAAGTFDLGGFSQSVGSLSGAGTVTSSSAGSITLTLGSDNTSPTFSGIVQNGSGTVAVTKTGTGTQTFSGNNTYSGTTTVSAGTLTVNGAQSASAVSLNGGTLAGTGSTGAVTSTASAGSKTSPAGAATGILTVNGLNWSSGAPAFSVDLNGTTAGSGYDQVNVASGTIVLTGATLTGTVGFTPANGATFTIVNNVPNAAITGTFSGLAEGATVTIGAHSFKISYVGGSGHSVVLTAVEPVLTLSTAVSPSATLQPPGTDLTYTITFTNSGSFGSSSNVVSDPIPNNTDFKVGSASTNLGTTGLSVTTAYSSDGGATWTYVPVSGAGGAPAGYDRNVTNVRWTFTGTLSQSGPNNTGSVSFTSRIR